MSSILPPSLPWTSALPPSVAPRSSLVHLSHPSLRHAHDMPFGPTRIDPQDARSGYRFRLWAPSAREVELQLIRAHGGDRRVRCELRDGWHVADVAQARAGDSYGFRIEGLLVPDPASRFNPGDVHAPSQIIDPRSFDWGEEPWLGRPWHEAVVYEMHVGTFTPEGTFKAAQRRLDYLAGMGITAIELMPLADFPGRRGWGYDGVLLFAPDASYGHPNDLKQFIRCAHEHGIMVLLDVVYNHFGPEGNYLHAYAPEFFRRGTHTAWGEAINFDAQGAGWAREFFLHNALYWLEEYRIDGLRIDAAHAIEDRSDLHFLHELSSRARAVCAARHVHLVLEHNDNRASLLGAAGSPGLSEAQWNDDFHHAAHVLLTGERQGYYADFAVSPLQQLVRCLCEGFAYQGEPSLYAQRPRGEPSADLPSTAFVNFLQNHDQVGNRLGGERLSTLCPPHQLRALVALQLLAPGIPMIFMGEEFAATTPFLFHCDFEPALARSVREGRQREHAVPANEADGGGAVRLADPGDVSSFLASKLNWQELLSASHREWLELYERLLAERSRVIVPLLPRLARGAATCRWLNEQAFSVHWLTTDGQQLVLAANLGDTPAPGLALGAPLMSVGGAPDAQGDLPAWSVHYGLGAAPAGLRFGDA